MPLAYDVMKFDTAPPGHDATRISPIATMGGMKLWKSTHSRYVTSGRTIHWHTRPMNMERGRLNTPRKNCGLSPNATPYITTAMNSISSQFPVLLKLIESVSNCCRLSYILSCSSLGLNLKSGKLNKYPANRQNHTD